ncbi:hypothetical protein GCM10017567_18490 [Amycolatopsis bullii]|uniref:Uncharacterized protein n=1 Tax=Amycolatopsis bullii TaxID=941987 RepID=A0ABQ3K4Y5_9PSEU|nr:hypothetical protein GCM10017567_18490 [Amycolatopsis bullii]
MGHPKVAAATAEIQSGPGFPHHRKDRRRKSAHAGNDAMRPAPRPVEILAGRDAPRRLIGDKIHLDALRRPDPLASTGGLLSNLDSR